LLSFQMDRPKKRSFEGVFFFLSQK
jgi:hypothetical protein